jgi:hypothetical protein
MNQRRVVSAFVYFSGATLPLYTKSKLFVFVEAIFVFVAANWVLWPESLNDGLLLAVDLILGLCIGFAQHWILFRGKGYVAEITLVTWLQYHIWQIVTVGIFALLREEITETGYPMGFSFYVLAMLAMALIICIDREKKKYAYFGAITAILLGLAQTFAPIHPTPVNAAVWDITIVLAVVKSLKR